MEEESKKELLDLSQIAQNIPTYEELTPLFNQIPEISEIQQNFRQRLNGSNQWIENFHAVNELRQINKFHPQLLIKNLFPTILPEMLQVCENLRSNVQKLGFILIKEIYLNNSIIEIDQATMQKTMIKSFEKANFDKKFVQKEAILGIQNLENNQTAFCYLVIDTLCDLCFYQKATVCEMACQSLNSIIQKSMSQVAQYPEQHMLKLVETVSKSINGKRAKLKNSGTEIMKNLGKVLGDNFYEKYLSQNQATLLSSQLSVKKAKVTNFRDFKKNQASLLIQRQNTQPTEIPDQVMIAKTNSLNISEQNYGKPDQIEEIPVQCVNFNEKIQNSMISNFSQQNSQNQQILQETNPDNSGNIQFYGNSQEYSNQKQQQLEQPVYNNNNTNNVMQIQKKENIQDTDII